MRINTKVPLYLLFLLIIGFSKEISAQGKQANNWYFGNKAGITFQQGSPPVALLDGESISPVETGTACMSDRDGNLLFYSDGKTMYNKNHDIMTNGNDMGTWSSQGGMIVQDPGNENRYYFFNFATTGITATPFKFQYSIIDMTNGLGEVLTDQKGIFLYLNTTFHLSAVLHENMEDVWVVTHGLGINSYIAFKVTASGVITTPEISYAGTQFTRVSGYMKISSDGKWLGVGNFHQFLTELYHFDNSTGKVNNQNVVTIYPRAAWGVEFSPDNTKFYAQGGFYEFYQYDLTSGDPVQIAASGVQLANDYFGPGALQLGPDGKIYVGYRNNNGYLGVIHDPDKKGIFCNFEFHAVYLDGRNYLDGLPVFMQSYMRNPEFITSQYCSGTPTQFNIVNTNGIDSVLWKFHDPDNAPDDTSTLFSPLYTFSTADTFYVELTAYSGLLQRTVIDTVIIFETPTPDLGSDTIFCPNEPIFLPLDASPGTTFNWNGDLTPGASTFVVTDVGTYWVRVSDNGCVGRDTIIVARYEVSTVDLSNLDIISSNCGQDDGAITGIQFIALDPITVTWFDAWDNQVGTGNDLLNVRAGSYLALVTYGVNCTEPFGPYTIIDNNAPVIASASPQNDDHCNQGIGSISIIPETGNVANYFYSFNGTDYYPLTPEITGLTAGPYNITIKDQFDCTSAPVSVVVDNIEGPQVNCVPTNATGGNANGTITVNSASTNLTYQLDSGLVQSTGVFNGLAPGIYTITVTDAYNCPGQCEVTIVNDQGIPLLAMAGGAKKCLNELANSNIRVSGVMGVKDFTASLNFDGQKLQCIHFNDSLAGIIPTVYPATSRVVLEWHGSEPLPSNDTISLGELVFETLQAGFADINWNSAPETNFTDENGNAIYPQFHHGQIQVHELPVVELTNKETYCQGDSINLVPQIRGGTTPMTWHWSTPEGIKIVESMHFDSALINHSGQYTFSIVDYFGCADEVTKAIQVTPLPTANFPTNNGTIHFEQSYILEATEGYASYEWNTSDTIYYINVTIEGDYTVTMKTAEGCEAIESVYMFETYIPILVPNAFTPNSDGLNDIFKPVVNAELVHQFSMSIYNKWGQRIFDTTSASEGWDGKDILPGVYNWVISYSNVVGKVFQMKGSVMVVK